MGKSVQNTEQTLSKEDLGNYLGIEYARGFDDGYKSKAKDDVVYVVFKLELFECCVLFASTDIDKCINHAKQSMNDDECTYTKKDSKTHESLWESDDAVYIFIEKHVDGISQHQGYMDMGDDWD
jgi:hypothetical protein